MAGGALLGNGHMAACACSAQRRLHIAADVGFVSNVLLLYNHHFPIHAVPGLVHACCEWRGQRVLIPDIR